MEISHLHNKVNVSHALKLNKDLCVSVGGFKPPFWLSLCPGSTGERASGGGIKYSDTRRKAAENRNMKSAGLPSFLSPSSVNYNPIKALFLFFSHDFVAFVGKFHFHRRKHKQVYCTNPLIVHVRCCWVVPHGVWVIFPLISVNLC